MKKILTRSGIAVATVAIVLAGAAAFSAYEAHIVNVTATIDNATSISTEALAFGQVFPQEILHQPVTLALSQSFTQSGALGVDYVIKQKPKCMLGVHPAGGDLPTYVPVTEDANGNFACPQYYQEMPLLCPFLSKTSDVNTDTSVPAFHGPLTDWTDATSIQTQAVGHLTQANPSTTWDIDLHVPCFKGECAQDWAKYVHDANPTVDPNAYMLDPGLKGDALGCDLWYEMTSVNRAPTQKVGATFVTYPTPSCTVTMDGGTIQSYINNSQNGDTICVPAGTYQENITVNKDVTVVALHAPDSADKAQILGMVDITANGATFKGFDVEPGSVPNQEAGITTSASNTTIDSNIVQNMSSTAGGSIKGIYVYNASAPAITGTLVNNNKVLNITNSAKGTYGVMVQGVVDNTTVTYNTIKDLSSPTGWGASGIEVTPTGATTYSPQATIIQYNHIENMGSGSESGKAITVDAASLTNVTDASQVTLSYNNFVNTPLDVRNLDAAHTLQAPNNWWGDLTPVTQGSVNTTPIAAGAYPQN